jgi:cytochrome c biogenesis protein CcdA
MTETLLVQFSLLAAFIAGMVALFAPCCITFLLPAYCANIFKEKKRILLMTFIYSLGIFTVMLPVVLGARMLSESFFEMHDQTYVIGGLFLIFVGFLALLGLKLPMPRINSQRQPGDPLSTYILGIIGGITSACCAPVLVGVLALTTLSPSLPMALLVGFFYVLGMVTPLYLASIFIERGNFLGNPIFRRTYKVIKLGDKEYPLTLANIVSFALFTLFGLSLIYLSLAGKLSMSGSEAAVTRMIQDTALRLTSITDSIPGLDVIFTLTATFLLFQFLKRAFNKNK